MYTFDKVTGAISNIIHPTINLSLTELGIVQDTEIIDDTVIVTFIFPFPNIPIADKLINIVTTQVEQLGLKLEYIVRMMKKEEKEDLLRMEKSMERFINELKDEKQGLYGSKF